MPQFQRGLDVYQGFNFKKDKQSAVGYITELQLGEDEKFKLVADQETIKDPLQPDQNLATKVVGVLSQYHWDTGITDAMYLSAQISTANKQKLAAALMGTWSSVDVKFNYVIFEYDQLSKKYFKSNWSDTVLEGVLEKNGDDLNLHVADEQSREVQSPSNYAVQVGIKPQTKEQAINMSTGVGLQIVKQWGVTETAR